MITVPYTLVTSAKSQKSDIWMMNSACRWHMLNIRAQPWDFKPGQRPLHARNHEIIRLFSPWNVKRKSFTHQVLLYLTLHELFYDYDIKYICISVETFLRKKIRNSIDDDENDVRSSSLAMIQKSTCKIKMTGKETQARLKRPMVQRRWEDEAPVANTRKQHALFCQRRPGYCKNETMSASLPHLCDASKNRMTKKRDRELFTVSCPILGVRKHATIKDDPAARFLENVYTNVVGFMKTMSLERATCFASLIKFPHKYLLGCFAYEKSEAVNAVVRK